MASLASVLVVGCVSPDKAMKSFLGQPSSELVAVWGAPQQRLPDGNGGEIWCYPQQREWTTPGQANTSVYGTGNSNGNLNWNPYGASYYGNSSVQANAQTTWTPPQSHSYLATRTFFVNPEGTVYRYAWRGY